MVLKFKDFLNEAWATATFSQVCKELSSNGWECFHKNSGDGITFKKDEFTVGGNLKHNASKDENRYVDVATLSQIRKKIISDFKETGDPTTINAIDWGTWSPLRDPFTMELKEYDRVTGMKKSELEMLSKITFDRKIFPNVCLIKNEDGEYNLCRSENDMRPLLDRWYPLCQYAKKPPINGKLCLGYEYDNEDDLDNLGTYLFEIKEDGTLGNLEEPETFVIESVKKI